MQLKQSTVGFVKRLEGREKIRPSQFKSNNKDVLREELVQLVLDNFAREGHQFQMLTLPSVWWIFEKLMVERMNQSNIHFSFYTTACERENKLFKLAVMNMPRTHKGLRYGYAEFADAEYVSSSVAKIFHTDIFDYMKYNETYVYDYIWLDLMTSLNWFEEKLSYVEKCTRKGSLVTVTFMKGRDGQEYVGKRKVITANIFQNMGFDLIIDSEYRDTVPMIQLTFKKR